MQNFEAVELLKIVLEQGNINLAEVLERRNMLKRAEILKKHQYKVWEGRDGWWYTYMPKPHGRVQRKRRTREELEDAIIEYYEKQGSNPTIREAFDEWNDNRLNSGKIAPGTHQRNQYLFEKYISQYGSLKVRRLTVKDLSEFLEQLPHRHQLTAKTFSSVKTIVRGVLKRCKRNGIIEFEVESTLQDIDTSDREFRINRRPAEEEVYSEDEVPRIMWYLYSHNDMHNTGVALMFATGIRVGELAVLKHSDFTDNTVTISKTETRYKGKDGHYLYGIKESPKTEAGFREIAVPEEFNWVLERIKLLNPFGEYVFMKGRRRLTTNVFRRRMKTICNELHIPYRSPHKIRKTYGTILLDSGIDKELIKGQMGHTNILTTERFYHRNRRHIDRKVEILSSVPEFALIDPRRKPTNPSKSVQIIQTGNAGKR